MAKSDLQVFVEMNEADTKNKTSHLGVSYHVVSARKAKGGAIVEMGAPESVIAQLAEGTHALLLLIVDRKEHKKYKG